MLARSDYHLVTLDMPHDGIQDDLLHERSIYFKSGYFFIKGDRFTSRNVYLEPNKLFIYRGKNHFSVQEEKIISTLQRQKAFVGFLRRFQLRGFVHQKFMLFAASRTVLKQNVFPNHCSNVSCAPAEPQDSSKTADVCLSFHIFESSKSSFTSV